MFIKKRKNKLKSLAAVGLSVTMMLSLGTVAFQSSLSSYFGVSAFASSVQDELSFSFNSLKSELTVTGKGKMPDYCEEQPAPWSGYAAVTAKVVINEGITTVSANAFAGFNKLTDVDIPDTVKSISDTAFDADASIKITASKNSAAASFAAHNNMKLVSREVSPSDITLCKVSPSDFSPSEVSLSEVSLSEASPADSPDLNPKENKQPDLTVTQTAYNKLRLEWKPVDGAVGYVIYCADKVDGKYSTIVTLKNVTSYVHSSRALDKVYYYKIKSITMNGRSKVYSDFSDAVSGFTHVDAPKPVTGVQINDIAYNKLKLTWNKSDDAYGYTIYCAESEDGKYYTVKNISSSKTTSYIHGSRKLDKTYYYKVVPYAKAGSKKIAAQDNKIFSGATHVDPPKPVSSISVTCTAYNKLNISWQPVDGAYGYTLYVANEPDGKYIRVTNLSSNKKCQYTHSGRILKKTYYYKVASYKKAGVFSIYADACQPVPGATFITAPAKPTIIANSNGTITIKRSSVSGASGYDLYRSENGSDYSLIKASMSSSYVDSNAIPGTEYSYKIKAKKNNAYSDFSNEVSVKAALSPATLTYAASASCSSVQLKWNKVTGATGYNVYVSTNLETGFTKTASVNAQNLSYVVRELDTNTAYFFKIEAYKTVGSKTGCAEFGNTRNATPTLTAPQGFLISTVGLHTIFAEWKSVADADGYEVYCGTSTNDMSLSGETTSTYYSITNLNTSTTYYSKVRAYRVVKGQKLYGSFSTTAKAYLSSSLSKTPYPWSFSYNVNNHTTPDALIKSQAKVKNINTIFAGDTSRKVIYLTMDCGYKSPNTEKNLNTLKNKNVKVTFFLTSYFINESPDKVQRMIDDGHILGNHTKSHIRMSSISQKEIQTQVKTVEDALYNKFGYKTHYFRYPYGEFSQYSQQQLINMGYTSVGWSFAYNDFSSKQPSQANSLKLIVKSIHPGAIFLLHNDNDINANLLGDFIDIARELGYEFETLDDIQL